MDIKVYQAFYKPEQIAHIQSEFIPYNNIVNSQPMLREYPFLLDLYEKHRHYDGYWGLVSWAFVHKTKLSSVQALKMISDNPGFDVYHFNAFADIALDNANPFTHGDETHHPGMAKFMNRLLMKIGYPNVNISNVKFQDFQFIYCSYYIGNQRFWDRWIPFLTACIQAAEMDPELNAYLHGYTSIHYGRKDVSNFSFVVERLVGLFVYMYEETISVKMFDCR